MKNGDTKKVSGPQSAQRVPDGASSVVDGQSIIQTCFVNYTAADYRVESGPQRRSGRLASVFRRTRYSDDRFGLEDDDDEIDM